MLVIWLTSVSFYPVENNFLADTAQLSCHAGTPCTPVDHWHRGWHPLLVFSTCPSWKASILPFQHCSHRSHPTMSPSCKQDDSPAGVRMSLTQVYSPCYVHWHRGISVGPQWCWLISWTTIKEQEQLRENSFKAQKKSSICTRQEKAGRNFKKWVITIATEIYF